MNELATDPKLSADANQVLASDPSASAWVSANAGTGKTEVLVRRFLRLLLAGVDPEKILCLTYTKTAAAEMQNRLLKELSNWATTETGSLNGTLKLLLAREPDEREIAVARRLFAQTLEAKGGLKIHTIHGFCERLLQRFPLEADVVPHFAVLDEAKAAQLRREAFDVVLGRAAGSRSTPLGKALDTIIAYAGEDQFRGIVDEVLDRRAELEAIIRRHRKKNWLRAEAEALRELFKLTPEDTKEGLVERQANVLSDEEIEIWLDILDGHETPTGDDRNLKQALETAKGRQGAARAKTLAPIFLTGKLEPRARLHSKALERLASQSCARLREAQMRFAELSDACAKLACAEASGALLRLADAVENEYSQAKRREAVLDYDDLILKARNLLSRAGAAAWVLFKIDGGIEHVLVDEAQDTNPDQWSIIERLSEEFFAGEGASRKRRTLFAVGDEKQSIYSFQGAEPKWFGEVGRKFRGKARAAAQTWHDVPLNVSFRSTEPVLEAVDAIFSKPPATAGVVWSDTPLVHHAFREGQPGLVELWEFETEEKPEPAHAFEPWNEQATTARAVEKLVFRIARLIRSWVHDGEMLLSENRRVQPGDILILLRRRDPFTTPMIRALKREGIPVAGADRMLLGEQLPVKDLLALADFLLLPEDDLALAIVLKSPLFGLDDEDLFELAYDRKGSLWTALKKKAETDARYAEAAHRLKRWLSRTDLAPPYEFFLEVLGEEGQKMRRRIMTRLGPEASEALDEFLDLALAYDREAAPSLQGFVSRFRLTPVEIKRDMEQARDEVRIMTVHGAKGLQAPIVFLPDTCMIPRRQGVSLYNIPLTAPRLNFSGEPDGHLIWPVSANKIELIESAKARLREAELEEYHRLLYVAMTRARDRLYVSGWHHNEKPEGGCWYDLINAGLAGRLVETEAHDGMTVRRLANHTPPLSTAATATTQATDTKAPEMPAWAVSPAPQEQTRRALLPSRIGGVLVHGRNKAEQPPLGPTALAENKRFTRGRLVHALLQYLPEVARDEQEPAARAFVSARGADLSEALREEIVKETLAILEEPRFAPFFEPGSLGEVPIVARITIGDDVVDLSGQIDRLVIRSEELLILDYKTNRPPPTTLNDVAPAYISQLAAYRLALREIYPEHSLRAAIIWTDGPKLMEIPSTLLDEAEARFARDGANLDAEEDDT
jgi:ATP-dependent helicase/nuclease subunit A